MRAGRSRSLSLVAVKHEAKGAQIAHSGGGGALSGWLTWKWKKVNLTFRASRDSREARRVALSGPAQLRGHLVNESQHIQP